MSHPAARGAIGVLGVVVIAASCSSPPAGRPVPSSPAPSTEPTPSQTLEPPAPAMSRTVQFEAIDGVRLEGRLFGSGRTGIVLSHMGNPGDSQADWYGVAEILAGRGYAILTYDRRGVCPGGIDGCSSGDDVYRDAWQDVLGAVRFLSREGVGEVFIGGASIGAMASLYAAEQPGVEVAGVIWVAGLDFASGYSFEREDVRRVAAPTLFVSATRDPYGAAESARKLYRWANPPTSLVLLRSDEHGTDMLSDPSQPQDADALTSSIVRFVDRHTS